MATLTLMAMAICLCTVTVCGHTSDVHQTYPPRDQYYGRFSYRYRKQYPYPGYVYGSRSALSRTPYDHRTNSLGAYYDNRHSQSGYVQGPPTAMDRLSGYGHDRHNPSDGHAQDRHNPPNGQAHDRHNPPDGHAQDRHNPPDGHAQDRRNPPDGQGHDLHSPTDGQGHESHSPPDGQGHDRHSHPYGQGHDRHSAPDGQGHDLHSPTDGQGHDSHSPSDGQGHDSHSPHDGQGHDRHSHPYGQGHDRHSPSDKQGHDRHRPPMGQGHDRHNPTDEQGHDRHSPPMGQGHDRHNPPDGHGHDRHSPPMGQDYDRHNSPDGYGHDRRNPPDAVAFSGNRNSTQYFFKSGPVIFDDVTTNIGGGYNSDYGVFTAFEMGIYLVNYNVASPREGAKSAAVDLLKNKEVINSASGSGTSGVTSNSAVLFLNHYDQLSVQGRAESEIFCGEGGDDAFCAFNVALLKLGYFIDSKEARSVPGW